MSNLIRILVIVISAAVFLFAYNTQIRLTDSLVKTGTRVLLPLRPVDPRAFMQGDYMALGYDQIIYPKREATQARPQGISILTLDENSVGSFARLGEQQDIGNALGENEVWIKYIRRMNGQVSYGGERYYFQEGMAELYEDAKYGIFHVSSAGQAVLTGLANEEAQLITATPTE